MTLMVPRPTVEGEVDSAKVLLARLCHQGGVEFLKTGQKFVARVLEGTNNGVLFTRLMNAMLFRY